MQKRFNPSVIKIFTPVTEYIYVIVTKVLKHPGIILIFRHELLSVSLLFADFTQDWVYPSKK